MCLSDSGIWNKIKHRVFNINSNLTNNNNLGHESFLTFLSNCRQFLSGKVPYSIDSDNKLYCPVNICFRLPHWDCRLATSDLVFTGCPTTEELEITGTFNSYYWNTGKLYHHAGKWCVFWNIGRGIMWAQKATCASSYEEGEKWLLFNVSVHTQWVWKSKIKISKWNRISVFKMWFLMMRVWWGGGCVYF